ncbi:MAG: ribBA [Bacillota bacterium]|nr:MAG: ribBA [Bacillota bacterium]MBS3949204.1 bifunctional 3,4-dihydroxy-2-butanone-4-phosphate synthase/GTP cyclohydrolase II [Peptococcaceae bacterium]
MAEANFACIPEILEELRKGKPVVVVDDENRENEGDLIAVAEGVTPETINFMITHGRGLVCLTLTNERADQLGLDPMVVDNRDPMKTAFTVSIDAREGTTTGISAYERALTIGKTLDPNARPQDFNKPGHVFPLRAKPGGVLRRAGHTEASVDLASLAGSYPAGVICEIINDDGTMARLPDLVTYCHRHNLKLCTIADLIAYRRKTEKLVYNVAEAHLPSQYGDFRLKVYKNDLDDLLHLAIVKGDLSGEEPTLVRVHSECLTGDVLGSLRCDCGGQLGEALKKIEAEGRGVVLYLRQEGRGIGLEAKIKAYALQDEGMDTVEANLALGYPADLRDYGIGAQILVDLGVKKLRLITNNPRKLHGLQGYGLKVIERVPVILEPREENRRYLSTKRTKLGHMLDSDIERNDYDESN